MRPIDADKALEMFRAVYKETENLIRQGETQLDSLAEGFTETAHIIKYLIPTVDAVPVVRCEDCTHAELVEWSERLCCTNFNGLFSDVADDDYCSHGERKTDV